MPNAVTLEAMAPQLRQGVDRARRAPQGRFHSLASRIAAPSLMRASHRQRASAAVGVEGITKEQYGQDLLGNLEDLQARRKAKTGSENHLCKISV
jgi:RNA-directed DNA polymerase